MATSTRYPLSHRTAQRIPLSSSRPAKTSTKRPRSPEAGPVAKRPKVAESRAAKDLKKDREEAHFRAKYRPRFPEWHFYFDADIEPQEKKVLVSKITKLHGHVEDFFSRQVTHLISNKYDKHALPATDSNKENTGRITKSTYLKSPSHASVRTETGYDLVAKALSFDMKVYSAKKMLSIALRSLGEVDSSLYPPTRPAPTLATLLKSERLVGTRERDPTQKRHDFSYFAKDSYFVLVEDMREELAPIIIQQYNIPELRGENRKTEWPVLYAHPHSRGPFIPYDEKEKRRRDKAQQQEKDKKNEQEDTKKEQLTRLQALRQKQQTSKKSGDLRRCVSMQNLRATIHEYVDLDDSTAQTQQASAYLQSGEYVAASGNSVGITSTTGTTSTANSGLRLPLSAKLRSLKQNEVLTRRSSLPLNLKDAHMMGPPQIPDKRALLKKSRSTNTLRLPKRDEGSKPGYCECCRVKFDDFKEHILSRKHRNFAANNANFSLLDETLSRVQRRIRQEIEDERGRSTEFQ